MRKLGIQLIAFLIRAHRQLTLEFMQSVEGVLGTSSYLNNKVNQWTSGVVEQCLNQLTKLGKPFKYIGTYWGRGRGARLGIGGGGVLSVLY